MKKEISDITDAWYDKYLKNPFAVLSFALAIALCVVIYHYKKDIDTLNKAIVQCQLEATKREQQRIKENSETFKQMLDVQEGLYKKGIEIESRINSLKKQ